MRRWAIKVIILIMGITATMHTFSERYIAAGCYWIATAIWALMIKDTPQ